MANKTIERFGAIDILINNAAIFASVSIVRAPFDQITLEEWQRVLAVNLTGVFLCSRAVFPQMKKQEKGKIINISSGAVFAGMPLYLHYTTTKAGIIGLTRSLARELGDYSINVNCIAPGSTLSEESPGKSVMERRLRSLSQRALKRIQYPKDLVGTAIFLASDDSDFITGQTIVVDGGQVMH